MTKKEKGSVNAENLRRHEESLKKAREENRQ